MMKSILFSLFAALCYAGPPNIIRPCSLQNYRCIAAYFAANSNCSRSVPGSIPPEYIVPKFFFKTPYFNTSYIENNLHVKNLNKCRVSEFFFNSRNNSAIFAIDCPQFGLESNRTVIKHAPLQEDKFYSYQFKGVFPLVRVTMNVRDARHRLNFCDATFNADFTLPSFTVTPNDKTKEDLSLSLRLSKDPAKLTIFEKEAFDYRAPAMMRDFLNLMICKFNC